MNPATSRLNLLSAWLNAASISYRLRSGHAVYVSRYASIVPVEMDEAPDADFHPTALPLYVSNFEIAGARIEAPDRAECQGQDRLGDRIAHLLFKAGDGTIAAAAWFPLTDPQEPPADVLDRFGASLHPTMPSIFVGTFSPALHRKERQSLLLRLPLISRFADMPDPAPPTPPRAASAHRSMAPKLDIRWPT